MKRLWKKTCGVLAAMTLLLSAAMLPASAASMTEDFEGYGSTDDLSLNWIGDGGFVSDLTLSKTGGVNGSKALKVDLTIDKNLKNHWAIVRALYPDMTSETATGFRFWAKCDQAGVKLKVHMRYNNMTWKYGKTVTLSKGGQYYEIPFSEMELTQGTVTADPSQAKDPMLIGEWQFELDNDWSKTAVTLYLDDMKYIEPGQSATTTTKAPVTPTTKPPVTGNTTTQPPISGTTQGDDPVTGPSSDSTAPSTDGTNGSTGATDPSGTTDPSADAVGPASNGATTSTGPSDGKGKADGGLSGGAIAAIVIAVVVVLAGAGAAVYFLVIRKKAAPAPQDDGPEGTDPRE